MPKSTMTQNLANVVTDEAFTALEKLAKDHHLKVSGGGGSYDTSKGTFTAKFTFTLNDAPKPEEVDFERYQSRFPCWKLGTSFTTANGVEYTLSGYKPRSRKRPMCITRVKDDVMLVCDIPMLERELGSRFAKVAISPS